ncbi:MAG: putative 4-hydroxybenzoate polyprenyltransferase [Prevotellaceae bacterium]|jgi:4-hydroxybenzoate polyprenyltransferase|nr:putative 4-hydroxybenzoate polyprenyltransferase [Prevotellaceae bacterium]
MSNIKNFFSLVKFAHTLFAMPFAMIGFFEGVQVLGVPFPWRILLLVVLCMVFARNSAMGFNRYLDRKYDAQNPRTSGRDIPVERVSPQAALGFVVVNCILFCVTSFFINKLTFYLSPVALLVVLGYSYTKRFTALCHFVLGLGLAIAPTGAYIAVTGSFTALPLLYSTIVLLWSGGFDILYALPDEDFDKSVRLKSIPTLLGRKRAMALSWDVHFITALIVVYIGFSHHWLYWIGAVIFTFLLNYQHIIVKPDNLSKLNAAFFTTNSIASICYAFFVIADLY